MSGLAALSGAAGIYRSPVAVAVGLALLSAVPIAWSLQIQPDLALLANEGWTAPPIDWRPIGTVAALALALAAAIPAALVGGFVGSRVWRRHRGMGALAALSSAWITGIVSLPLVAAVLSITLRTGIVCMFGCEAYLRDDQPWSGGVAYVTSLLVMLTGFPLLVLAGFLILLSLLSPFRWISLPAAVAAHVAVHAWPVWLSDGGEVAYVSLLVGVLLWAAWQEVGTSVSRSDRAERD